MPMTERQKAAAFENAEAAYKAAAAETALAEAAYDAAAAEAKTAVAKAACAAAAFAAAEAKRNAAYSVYADAYKAYAANECPECGEPMKDVVNDVDGTNLENGQECSNPDCSSHEEVDNTNNLEA
jgi:membrane protein involved in colicin uptake